jgi:hypothetical protein
VQNADFGISHHSMNNQAPKKHLDYMYDDFHVKLPFELDCTASAIDIGISYRPVDSKRQKKEHLMKIGIDEKNLAGLKKSAIDKSRPR